MGNLTSSQENPDSSPGFALHLASFAAQPSQGPAAPAAMASRNGADREWGPLFSRVGWERGKGARFQPQPECLALSTLLPPVYAEKYEVGESKTWGGSLIKIYNGYKLFWNLGEKKPFL